MIADALLISFEARGILPAPARGHCIPPPDLLRQRRSAKIYRPPQRYYLTFGTLPEILLKGFRSALAQNEIFRSRKQLFRDYSAETLYFDTMEPLLQDKL